MSRRFHPTGKGWIRVYDAGGTAAWLRPSQDGQGVEGVVLLYNHLPEDHRRPYEVWTVYEPTPVTRLDDIVFNKAFRVRHLAHPDRLSPTWWDGTPKDPADLAHEQAIVWSLRRVGPAFPRRHRRDNWNRHVYVARIEQSDRVPYAWYRHAARLPRKLRKALHG